VREPPPPRERAPGTPPDLDALCSALLAFDPSARPLLRPIARALGVDAAPATSSAPGASASMTGDELFVGRQPELAALAALFERARSGQMATGFVVGESGVGKSSLLRRFTNEARAAEPTALILRGRCYERESVHFKAFDGLIDALSRHMARMGEEDTWDILPNDSALLPQVFPVMGRVRGIARATRPLRGPRDPGALRTRVFAILREVFSNLAARRAVVVTIDDFQWADADSQVLLSALVREPGAPPICMLVTSRDASSAPDSAEVIEVGSLPRDDAEELVRRLLEQMRVAGADARAIAAETGGHPLFIDEMVRHAALSGEPGMHLDDAIRARVGRLQPQAAQLLRVVSVAGVPLSMDVARTVSGLDPGQMERATSQLRVARMMRSLRQGQLEVYHDRVRKTVIEAITADERRAMHGRLAAALETGDLVRERPEVMVRHLVAAGDQQAAAAYALRAAKRAASAFAFDRAADLYRLALESGAQDAAGNRALRIDLATVLAHAGRGRDAAPLYLEAASGADPATRVECQRLAARHLLQSGHFEQGIDALREALAEQELVLPKTPRRALMSLLWQRARLRVRGLRWRRRHPREIADSQLARVDVLLDVGEALGMFDSIRGADFQLRGLREALRLGEPTRVARGLCVEAIYAASQGGRSVARSRDLVVQLQSLVREVGDPFLEALAVTAVGIVDYLGGDLVAASEHLAEVVERFGDLGSSWELNNARLFYSFTVRWTGELDRRAEVRDVDIGDAHRRGDMYMETAVRMTSSLLLLAKDRSDDAELDLDAVSWRPPAVGFHLQHWWELEARTELAIYRGDTRDRVAELEPQFRALGKSLLLRIQFVRANSVWVWARLCLALGEERQAEASRAARKLAHEGVDYAQFWSALLSAALASERDPRGAAEMLAEAAPIAERIGMPLLARVAELRRAQLRENDSHAADAIRWLRAQGAVDPDRLAAVLAPGFTLP